MPLSPIMPVPAPSFGAFIGTPILATDTNHRLQRTDTVSSIFIPKMFVERLRLSDGAAFHFTFPPIFQNQRRRKS
jgi:hypothetical protein